MRKNVLFSMLCNITLFAFSLNLSAQATRTWVSGVGDDVNPCSRTAPCKTFAGAISKTAAGGEINAIDPGGMGSVTITKSMTIDGKGTFASILSSMTNGVTINAGPEGVVILRNLSINGAGNGISGIKIISAKKVYVEYCTIAGFTSKGIEINTLLPSTVILHNVTIQQTQDAIAMTNEGGRLIMDDCRIIGASFYGLNLFSGKATINRTNISDCKAGIMTAAGTSVSLSENLISNNGTGISGNGSFSSTGNNIVTNNIVDGNIVVPRKLL